MTMRRVGSIILFLVFILGVVWYATAYVSTPTMTFNEAAQVGDPKKKVMINGTVLEKDLHATTGGSSSFIMVDETGTQLKVSLDETDKFTPGQLSNAAKTKSKVSVAGHSHGDYFHASDVFFPAN